jgi:hypothetical protein
VRWLFILTPGWLMIETDLYRAESALLAGRPMITHKDGLVDCDSKFEQQSAWHKTTAAVLRRPLIRHPCPSPLWNLF